MRGKVRDQISTPFQNVMGGKEVHNKSKPGDVMDRNVCPVFSMPRDPDHDGDPEVFFVGVRGSNHHGPVKGASILSSPMNGPEQPK
jgi:hypothetical protein